jgi:hypothetical protein
MNDEDQVSVKQLPNAKGSQLSLIESNNERSASDAVSQISPNLSVGAHTDSALSHYQAPTKKPMFDDEVDER